VGGKFLWERIVALITCMLVTLAAASIHETALCLFYGAFTIMLAWSLLRSNK
jgi:hypothetical protein